VSSSRPIYSAESQASIRTAQGNQIDATIAGVRAFVRLRLPDGTARELGHGDLIGRLPSAALHIDDARVSEAHALISLRGRELKLLALRGRFAIEQKPMAEVVLREGLTIWIARDLSLVVDEVVLPDAVLALEGDGLARQVLSGVCSLTTTPRPALIPRYVGDASAWIWSVGEAWRIRLAKQDPRPLAVGDVFVVDDRRFEVMAVTLEHAGHAQTHALGAVSVPLRLVANYDTAHIHRAGEPAVALTGISARILGELVACGAPVSWRSVAVEIWSEADHDNHQLRRKWDINLARLRRKLKDARIRPNLVRSDRTGNVEIFLADGDVVEDRT